MNIIFKAKDPNTGQIVTGTSLIKESDGYAITNTMEYDGVFWWPIDENGEAIDDITFIDISTLEIITN